MRTTYAYSSVGNLGLIRHGSDAPVTFTNVSYEVRRVQQGSASTTYTYDSGNIRVEIADGSRTTYTYDGDGKRRSAHLPTGTLTTFVWEGDDYLQKTH